jgi:hypothetical protein
MQPVPYELVKAVKEFLGPLGIDLFNHYLDKYGEVSPVFVQDGLPHPVHFREGMHVRNFMRGTPYCRGWDAYDLDNQWADIVLTALKLEKTND